MITEKLVLFIMKSSHYDLRFDDDSIRTILLYDYVIHLAKKNTMGLERLKTQHTVYICMLPAFYNFKHGSRI